MYVRHDHSARHGYDHDETLMGALSLGLPLFFNLERMIDKAERGEWGGLWW